MGRKGYKIVVKCENDEIVEFETITELCLAINKKQCLISAWRNRGYLPKELIEYGIVSITFGDQTLTYFPKKYTENKKHLTKSNN